MHSLSESSESPSSVLHTAEQLSGLEGPPIFFRSPVLNSQRFAEFCKLLPHVRVEVHPVVPSHCRDQFTNRGVRPLLAGLVLLLAEVPEMLAEDHTETPLFRRIPEIVPHLPAVLVVLRVASPLKISRAGSAVDAVGARPVLVPRDVVVVVAVLNDLVHLRDVDEPLGVVLSAEAKDPISRLRGRPDARLADRKREQIARDARRPPLSTTSLYT